MWVHLTNQPAGARECKQADSPGQANPQKHTEGYMKQLRKQKKRPTREDQKARESLNYWLARIKLKALRALLEGKTDV